MRGPYTLIMGTEIVKSKNELILTKKMDELGIKCQKSRDDCGKSETEYHNNGIVEDFKANRDNLSDYRDVIETLVFSYIRTEDFAAMSEHQRNNLVDCIIELELLITNIEKIRIVNSCSV